MSENEERIERPFETAELLAAVLLGLAAIATAWASYESALYGGKSVENYSKANKIATDAADEDEAEAKKTALQEELLEKAMEKDLADDEEYRREVLAKSQALLDESEKTFKQGQEENETGDKFQLIAVVYAISLFFGGIVQVFRNDRARRAILAAGALFFLGATAYMLTLPGYSPQGGRGRGA